MGELGLLYTLTTLSHPKETVAHHLVGGSGPGVPKRDSEKSSSAVALSCTLTVISALGTP
jgi:hypothetical protein